MRVIRVECWTARANLRLLRSVLVAVPHVAGGIPVLNSVHLMALWLMVLHEAASTSGGML